MSHFDTRDIYQSAEFQQELGIQRTFMTRVYGWMTIGLLATALTALVVSGSESLRALFILNTGMMWALIIAQVVTVLAFVFLIQRISAPAAAALFVAYSILTGMTFSVLFMVYTSASIYATFFVTAGMFGAMSVFGYVTKKDLSGMGSFLFMGLIGIIIASVVNFFMHSSALSWFISFFGVIIFTGLTAYDTQKIKQGYATGAQGSGENKKTALFGAFTLYLDFINLFLFLLRFMGNRRN